MTSKQHDFKAALERFNKLESCNTDLGKTIQTALRLADILQSEVKPWHIMHYEDWRDTDQVIDRHNEDGMEELSTIAYKMIKEVQGE